LSELFKTEEMKENAVKIIRMLIKVREVQQRQLARVLNMSEGSVSKILIKLEDHGYCTKERQAIPEGGSRIIVRSTL
jgi:Mn-dependent DtxR family transcriptional regulator